MACDRMKFTVTLWVVYVSNIRILVRLPNVSLVTSDEGFIQLARAYVVISDLSICQI